MGRVDGPYSRVVWTGAREHGPWTRVVCTDPYCDVQTAFFVSDQDEQVNAYMCNGNNKDLP